MTTTEVDIYNQALSAVGTNDIVTAVDEVSEEAAVCSRWYETVRDMVLRAAPWKCATGINYLALLATRDTSIDWAVDDPPPGWIYSYAYPSDMIRPRFLDGYGRMELGITSTNIRVVHSNTKNALLTYTRRQTRVDLWDEDLSQAVVFALAAHIALKLTGDIKRVGLATAQALDAINVARVAAANEDEARIETIPDWITARGSNIGTPYSRYYYPSAEFVAPSAAPGKVT